MTKNEEQNIQTEVETNPTSEWEARVIKPQKATDELVMEAQVVQKQKGSKPAKTQKPSSKKDGNYSSTCIITNASQNKICLMDGIRSEQITVAPREIKTVDRDLLRKLLKNPMIQRFFDKGILTHTLDAKEVSAHDAVVPEELKNPVERHENGQNVVAEVKKYEKEGSIKIDLE